MSRADREMDQETPRPSRSGRSSNRQKENNHSRENSLSRENSPIPPSSEVAPPKNPSNKATKKGPRVKPSTVPVDDGIETISKSERPVRQRKKNSNFK